MKPSQQAVTSLPLHAGFVELASATARFTQTVVGPADETTPESRTVLRSLFGHGPYMQRVEAMLRSHGATVLSNVLLTVGSLFGLIALGGAIPPPYVYGALINSTCYPHFLRWWVFVLNPDRHTAAVTTPYISRLDPDNTASSLVCSLPLTPAFLLPHPTQPVQSPASWCVSPCWTPGSSSSSSGSSSSSTSWEIGLRCSTARPT